MKRTTRDPENKRRKHATREPGQEIIPGKERENLDDERGGQNASMNDTDEKACRWGKRALSAHPASCYCCCGLCLSYWSSYIAEKMSFFRSKTVRGLKGGKKTDLQKACEAGKTQEVYKLLQNPNLVFQINLPDENGYNRLPFDEAFQVLTQSAGLYFI